MFEKIDKKKLAGLMLAGVITVTGTTSAFAADQPSSKPPAVSQKQFFKIDKADLASKIKSVIDSLVTAGTITEVQKEAVLNVFPRKDIFTRHMTINKSSIDNLVTSGTITQAQADAIENALKPAEEVLDGLVSAGTITQAQEDVILKAIPFRVKRFMDRGEHNGSLNNLITAGTITEAQADAINAAVKSALDSLDKQ